MTPLGGGLRFSNVLNSFCIILREENCAQNIDNVSTDKRRSRANLKRILPPELQSNWDGDGQCEYNA